MHTYTYRMCAHIPRQAQYIFNTNRFHKEQHIHALANMVETAIVVFQEKDLDGCGSRVDITYYSPKWDPPAKLTRTQLKKHMKGAVLLHLDKKVTHFSAIVPDEILPVEEIMDMSPRAKRQALARCRQVHV